MQPGQRPEDNIETVAITMVNQAGEVHDYSWIHGAPVSIDKPAQANIEIVNTKSRARPFLIVSDERFRDYPAKLTDVMMQGMSNDDKAIFMKEWNALTKAQQDERSVDAQKKFDAILRGDQQWYQPGPGFYTARTEIIHKNSIFPWWNHWPVAQIPSDGRWATEVDRVSHSSLTTGLWWKDLELTETKRVRAMMMGLTERQPKELVALSRSWNNAPELKGLSAGYVSDGYAYDQKAYKIDSQKQDSALQFEVAATKDQPVVNLALVITGWGDADAKLTLNGRQIQRGADFRYGHRKTTKGKDLVVWIKTETSSPLKVKIERAG
jgi:hypothetical protein